MAEPRANEISSELIRFDGAEQLARNVAGLWLDQISVPRGEMPYCVALSGGRIAGRLFAETARQARERKLSLARVEFFWADERCVPPTDPESNFKLAQENLFAPLGIDPSRVHRIRGELDKNSAADSAEADLRRIAPVGPDGQPVLDLVLLGMGEDGHVASLFPNQLDDPGIGKAAYRAVIGSKPPPARVTLTYPALAIARQAWVLASGAGKEEALRLSLSGGRTPLGRLLQLRRATKIFTDIAP